jgi:16S rRNA (cytosine967-C5)-methyltransferase
VSSGVTAGRRAALDVLLRVRRGELADRALAAAGEGLDPRDHAWVQELVYGTLRLRGRIDHLLGAFVRSGLESLDPEVLDVLRLGAYQLQEMGSVPAYAAVSQSVELVRAAGAGRAAGLVNGVLQAVRREGASVEYPPFADDAIGHLATWGSHPRWLVERWVRRWGPEEAKALVEANNRRPDLYLTPIGLTVDAAVARLRETGIAAEGVPGFPDSVRVVSDHRPIEALRAVPSVVQDPASAMVVRYAGADADAVAYDLSAAPGGKTVGLVQRASFVVAADLSLGRMRRVRGNVRRVGMDDRVGLVVADGRHPPLRPGDLVLLDAPCTGTGTLRRHPDGRWRLSMRDIEALTGLQRDLLAAGSGLVRPGGRLVYSTCSVEPEENEKQVERFLSGHPEFALEPGCEDIEETMLNDGYLTVLPQRHGVDGAFAARLVRRP